MVKKQYITWENYGNLLDKLFHELEKTELKFDYLYGPPRGALPIVSYLGYRINVEIIYNLDNNILNNSSEILIVDDISDTGETFLQLLNKFKIKSKLFFATLHMKPRTAVIPDIYIDTIPNDIWVVYPYEIPNEIPNRDL